MNRRSFVAAIPALVVSTAIAQESSPTADPAVDMDSFLRSYIRDVFNDRNPDAVVDYFDDSALSIMEVYRDHANTIDLLDPDYDVPVRLVRVTTSDAVAMGYGWAYIRSWGRLEFFVIVEIGDSGLITSYRYQTFEPRD